MIREDLGLIEVMAAISLIIYLYPRDHMPGLRLLHDLNPV